MPGRPTRPESGETLLELMVAIAIMAIAFTGILGGMGTSAVASDYHHKQAVAEGLLRTYAEQLVLARVPSGQSSPNAVAYADCATTYSTATAPQSAGFTWSAPTVKYWDGVTTNPLGFASSCPAGGDKGLQQVTIEVRSTDGRADESLTILKRRL